MGPRALIILLGLSMTGCISSSYQHLATQAGVRISTTNGELAKMAESSRLSAEDRAHYVALLDEVARKIQIEADRELVLRKALKIEEYPLFVQTILAAADSNAAAISSLAGLRDAMQADIALQYQAVVVHATELSAAAKGLAQLGTSTSAKDALGFLLQFALDVGKAYTDASKNAAGAKAQSTKATSKKATQQSLAAQILTLDRSLVAEPRNVPGAVGESIGAPNVPGVPTLELAPNLEALQDAIASGMQRIPSPLR